MKEPTETRIRIGECDECGNGVDFIYFLVEHGHNNHNRAFVQCPSCDGFVFLDEADDIIKGRTSIDGVKKLKGKIR